MAGLPRELATQGPLSTNPEGRLTILASPRSHKVTRVAGEIKQKCFISVDAPDHKGVCYNSTPGLKKLFLAIRIKIETDGL